MDEEVIMHDNNYKACNKYLVASTQALLMQERETESSTHSLWKHQLFHLIVIGNNYNIYMMVINAVVELPLINLIV